MFSKGYKVDKDETLGGNVRIKTGVWEGWISEETIRENIIGVWVGQSDASKDKWWEG